MANSEPFATDVASPAASMLGMGHLIEVTLDLAKSDHSDVGAMVLSYLFVPSPDALATPKRGELQRSLRSRLLDLHGEDDPEWNATEQTIAPADLRRPAKRVAADLRRLDRCLRDRVLAGHLALRYVWEVDPSFFSSFEPELKQPSKNWLVETLGEEVGQEGKSIERLLRQSKPVLHLAAAYAFIRQNLARHGGSPHWCTTFWDERFLRWLLGLAERLEPLLIASRFGLRPDEIVRFRRKSGDEILQDP